jgi:hypothetical protein
MNQELRQLERGTGCASEQNWEKIFNGKTLLFVEIHARIDQKQITVLISQQRTQFVVNNFLRQLLFAKATKKK